MRDATPLARSASYNYGAMSLAARIPNKNPVKVLANRDLCLQMKTVASTTDDTRRPLMRHYT